MKLLKTSLLALMAIVTFSCSDNDSGTSRVVVSMTDAPGDYDAVNVDVVDD